MKIFIDAKDKFLKRSCKNIKDFNKLKHSDLLFSVFCLSISYFTFISFDYLEIVLGKDLSIIPIIFIPIGLLFYIFITLIPYKVFLDKKYKFKYFNEKNGVEINSILPNHSVNFKNKK